MRKQIKQWNVLVFCVCANYNLFCHISAYLLFINLSQDIIWIILMQFMINHPMTQTQRNIDIELKKDNSRENFYQQLGLEDLNEEDR